MNGLALVLFRRRRVRGSSMIQDFSSSARLAPSLSESQHRETLNENSFESADGLRETMERQAETIERLTAALAAIGGIAHELNNRVTVILGFSQLLLDCQANDTARKHVAMIEDEARRMGEIVGSVTAFARPDKAGRVRVQLADVLEKTLKLNGDSLRRNRVTVDFTREPNLPEVLAEPQALMTAMLNLIMSVESAIGERRAPGSLRIRMGTQAGLVWVRFEDADSREESSAQAYSSVMGVKVCEAVMREHGGTIEAADGGVVAFILTLPAAEPV
jgi:signal transduction histidine kinase